MHSRHRDLARRLGALLPALLLLGTAAAVGSCGAAGGAPDETLAVTCEGKCDGWGSITSLYRNADELDLGDLLSVSAGFATDGLNDALSASDYASIEVAAPKLYALDEKARNDLTLGNLDQLVSGLAARFGERELTTEVNALRRAHLESSSDEVYGESAFRIDAGLKPAWHLATGGFDGTVTLGFTAGAGLEARVIGAYPTELGATLSSPLAALRQSRGFVLPRSVGDLQGMKPGESFALRGSGSLGLNLGVGVPLLVAEPATAITYSLVVSAGLRTMLDGAMDVQLVRLGDDEVVVDIGVDQATVRSARIALDDAWGVQGLIKSKIEVGGVSVDLGRLLEKALQKQMNAKLSFISARAEATKTKTRLSVARLRFSLAAAAENPAVEQALAQALRGDVRLAQALANRGEAGVVAVFDLSRTGVSAVSHAGIDIFGMSFFRDVAEGQGSVVVQTPGGARTILFDSLHRESGWFFSNHGYTRVGLSGLVYDARNGQAVQGEANLFLQVEEGDDYMERDKLLDHLDGVIASLGGPEALAAVEAKGNQLQQYVVAACPNSQAFDPCRTQVLSDATVVALRADGEAALAAAVGGLEPAQRDMVVAAGRLRLTAQATLEPAASLVGPPTSVVLDLRLDDAALNEILTQKDKYALRTALLAYLSGSEVDRGDGAGQISADRAALATRYSGALDNLGRIFEDQGERYARLLAAERAAIENLGTVGTRALEVRFAVDAQNRPVYEEATARSLAQARAQVATALFDQLVAAADGVGPHPEQTVTYALLALTARPRADVRLDVDMSLDDTWAQSFDHYRAAGYASLDVYSRGSAVTPIDGGLFSVDAFLKME